MKSQENFTSKKPAKRRRNPSDTRLAILEAAGKLLAKDGPEGLTVFQVAQLAGVNRGTAYQHFQTREQLLTATTAWVSEKLCRAVFGDPPVVMDDIKARRLTEDLVEFVMDNPELGRVWLFELLNSSRPSSDPFWKQYKTTFEKFAKSELAQPDIDVEVHAVMMLIGAFLWPVWARAHTRTTKQRRQMVKRFSHEVMRLALHGTMRPDKYREFEANLADKARVTASSPK